MYNPYFPDLIKAWEEGEYDSIAQSVSQMTPMNITLFCTDMMMRNVHPDQRLYDMGRLAGILSRKDKTCTNK